MAITIIASDIGREISTSPASDDVEIRHCERRHVLQLHDARGGAVDRPIKRRVLSIGDIDECTVGLIETRDLR